MVQRVHEGDVEVGLDKIVLRGESSDMGALLDLGRELCVFLPESHNDHIGPCLQDACPHVEVWMVGAEEDDAYCRRRHYSSSLAVRQSGSCYPATQFTPFLYMSRCRYVGSSYCLPHIPDCVRVDSCHPTLVLVTYILRGEVTRRVQWRTKKWSVIMCGHPDPLCDVWATEAWHAWAYGMARVVWHGMYLW